jgi:hypothetical protein
VAPFRREIPTSAGPAAHHLGEPVIELTEQPRLAASAWPSTAWPPGTPGTFGDAVEHPSANAPRAADDDASHLGPTVNQHIKPLVASTST